MRPGQGDRQLDLDEGGRGGVPRAGRRRCLRYGAAVVVMAFDEEGQADTAERKVEICAARLQHAHRDRSASRPRTSSSTPTSSPWRRGSRSTTTTPSTSSRRRAGSRQNLPARPGLRRGVERVVPLPRQRAGAPGDPLGVPLPRHRAPAWTWASSTPATCRSMTTSTRELREAVEDVILNRPAATATERLVEIAESTRAASGERKKAPTWPGATAGRRSASSMPWSTASPSTSTPTPRRRGCSRAPAARHRRPADGRHERRRRPVRLGQDVPAAGGEVGPRDEAGGGLPDAVHGGREGGARPGEQAGRRS